MLKEIHPDLINDYKHLKTSIKEQKDENEQLYKQLLNLKKETASAAQKIALCTNRIQRLENNVGLVNQQNVSYYQQHNDGSLEDEFDWLYVNFNTIDNSAI